LAGLLIRQAITHQHEHPTLTERREAYAASTLSVLLAIARRLHVPETDLPAPLPPYDRDWLSDLCNIAGMERAEAETMRRQTDGYTPNSFGRT